MAGGGDYVEIRGKKVPAMDWFGMKVARHRLTLGTYAVTFGLVYAFMATRPAPKLNPTIGASDKNEEAFIKDYLKQRMSEERSKPQLAAGH